jgi:CRP/FNR family transcriptional regulator, cyclic AMP receptor protein
VVSKLGDTGRVIRMTGLGPGDFFGEMTLIEVQNRLATVVTESPTVLYELTALARWPVRIRHAIG